MKIDLLIPCFNSSKFILPVLESINSQDIIQELEIIIADDHSVDNTEQIIKSFSSVHKITYFRHKEQIGVVENCNFLLTKITGDFAAFLGHDDILLPDKLKKQIQVLEENKELAFCSHDYQYFFSSSKERGGFSTIKLPRLYGFDTAIINGIPTLGVMGRSNFLRNLKFDNRCPYADTIILYKILANGHNAAHISESLILYNRHEQNITSHKMSYDRRLHDKIIEHFILMSYKPNKIPLLFYRVLRYLISSNDSNFPKRNFLKQKLDLFGIFLDRGNN
jgi:glycosyltransferase involved in cell wall biosynthesis